MEGVGDVTMPQLSVILSATPMCLGSRPHRLESNAEAILHALGMTDALLAFMGVGDTNLSA